MSNHTSQALTNFANLASTLSQQFNKLKDDFNNQNWDDLKNNVLDPKVLIVGIDHPREHTYSGIDKVIQFMMASGGNFDPIAPVFQVIGDHGYALGVGNWRDRDDPNDGLFLFSFIFVNRASHNHQAEWKAIRLWGSRPLGDLKES